MTRKEFLKVCGMLGVFAPMQTLLSSCEKEILEVNFDGKVLIIGAGAAGLSAAYLLQQSGVDYTIVEAAGQYGGRMKRTIDFANFPIPLGAEWLHVGTDILPQIVNDNSITIDIVTKLYDPNTDYGLLDGEQLSLADLDFTEDRKFIDATWFDFYEQYIVPTVQDQIMYNTAVESIDYSGDQVRVQTNTGEFVADKVIISIPVKILQSGRVNFIPALPEDKLDAINQVTVWDGCKAFIEFSEKFYPAFTPFIISPETAGQKLYYDASYGQNTNQHILGLFAVGTGTLPYVDLNDADLIAYMLNELDAIYDNKASATYVKHIFQNWNEEPFIGGAYVNDHEDWRKVRTLGESVADKLFFAGTSYTTGQDWGSVHTAAQSARRAIEELTK